jgi:hypothetical protein
MITLPENNRTNGFINWWTSQMNIYDCDPHIYSMKYLFSRLEFNIEQIYWFCWIFANTYQLSTAFVIWNEFPDFENVDFERLDKWEDNNYSKLPYQNDQKWMKGNLSKIFIKYRDIILKNNSSQHEYFQNFNTKDGNANFDLLWKIIIDEFYKFGRYTTWFYMQCLKELCHINLIPSNLRLNSHGSHSHRSGLCFALGLDSWCVKNKVFTGKEIIFLEKQSKDILDLMIKKSIDGKINNQSIDYFYMETSLCSYKKLFRERDSRYLGFYLDRMAEDITKTSSFNWSGINWKLLWDCREEILLKEFNREKINKESKNLDITIYTKFSSN